ncbi:hypothetical protein Tco_1150656 [Tanacetum coccineum]
MDTTRTQQKALDDDLVAPANRLKIGKFNLRLSSNLNSKEPTLQVVLDALKLTSFYKAFAITDDVPKIYMQEFWVTASRHHSSLRFKMNGKSHTVNVENFRDMLHICPKLPGQKFEDPPFEEEILSFIRDLGHTGEIKVLSNVNVNHMHQPWRLFAAIINKCLSGKTTTLESLLLSRAQILWGMYHNMNVNYVYLLWEDLVYQVENKNSKKNNDITILPQHLTNQAMLESEAYKTYHAYATGEKIPKTKYVKNKVDPESSPKKKSAPASEGKRLKLQQSDEDNDQNDDNADTEDDDDQNDDNADTEDDDDQNNDNADNEGDDDQDDDNEQTESNNDDDDFVHPKLSTFDEKERQDEEDKEEE